MSRRGTPTVILRSGSASPLTAAQNDANLSNLKAGVLASSEVAAAGAYHSIVAENASINVDLPPSAYSPGKYVELRFTSTLGIAGANRKAVLETMANEADGGITSVFQMAHVGTGVPYYRTGLSADGWLAWQQFTTAAALLALINATDPYPQYFLRSGFPAGMINAFAGSSAPTGWLICDGSAVSRSGQAALFAAIGTLYGSGDDSTTFNLPDGRGRTLVGAGTGSGLTPRSLGTRFGEEAHALNSDENGPHVHANDGSSVSFDDGSGKGAVFSATGVGSNVAPPMVGNSASSGSGVPHNNVQPSMAVNLIIKV